MGDRCYLEITLRRDDLDQNLTKLKAAFAMGHKSVLLKEAA
jgi:hypothetical protein